MPTPLSDADFTAAPGVSDWRVLFWGAQTVFVTGDFAGGAQLFARIAEVSGEVGHAPIVKVVGDNVAVQLITPGMGLTDLDLALARRISEVAADLGFAADPTAVQQVQLALDVGDAESTIAFWQAALGYVRVSPTDLIDPNLATPALWFQEKAYESPRNRIHVDVSVPHDVAEARVQTILDAGGRMLGDRNAPAWWSLIDPEGNVVDIATWQGRD